MLLDVNDVEVDHPNRNLILKNSEKFLKLGEAIENGKTVILLNKSDTIESFDVDGFKDFTLKLGESNYKVFQAISCTKNQGLQDFIDKLADQVYNF